MFLVKRVILRLKNGFGALACQGPVMKDENRAGEAANPDDRAVQIGEIVGLPIDYAVKAISKGMIGIERDSADSPHDQGARHPEQESCQACRSGGFQQRLLARGMRQAVSDSDDAFELKGRNGAKGCRPERSDNQDDM